MTQTIIGLAVAYALMIAVTALIWLRAGRYLLPKLALVAAVAVLVFVTCRGIGDLRGLPSDAAPPERFRLHWAEIVEPDMMAAIEGSVFLWITALDADYYLVGQPRAYRLPYCEELATAVQQALGAIADGEDIQGEVGDPAAEARTADDLAAEIAADPGEGGTGAALGERFLSFDFGSLSFGEAQAPVTPEKQD